jgi:hypothetical protein
MIDNQQLAQVLSKKQIFKVLTIKFLAKFANLLKLEPSDNERVSQCYMCFM